ncbi:MAG TPA: hypothetical protein VKH15_16695 [Candidatus Acidoferrum sp.]|nr:hypothetical protein [Candidatus Acidoferrum sp.]
MRSESAAAFSRGMACYYRWLFLAAAAWNLLSTGAVLFFLTDARFRLRMGFPGSPDTISLQLLASCLFVFGLGYYWVSRDLWRNRDLVKLGVVGKPLVFLVFFWHALAKEIPMLLVIPSVVDLLFGALFLEFLIRTRIKAQ